MSYSLTQTLAEFASSLKFDQLSEEAKVAVRLGWTDYVAALLGGKDLPICRIPYEAIVKGGSATEAGVFFSSDRASSSDAALANGIAAHGLDMDDIALRGSHPSAVLVAAIMAEAEKRKSSGEDVMAAYAAGFEVWAHIVEREKDSYVPKGWHLTAVVGGVAAAASVANLKQCSAEVTRHAMAIAASCAAGTVAGWYGMTKPFQVGRAAQAGVMAVQLAEAGMVGSAEPLEGKGGLLQALSPQGNLDFETPIEGLGTVWQLVEQGIHTKLYPFTLRNHRAIDGMMELTKTHNLKPEDVTKITLFIGPSQAKYVLAGHAPEKYEGPPNIASIWLAAACALVARRASLAELEPAFWERPEVDRFRSMIDICIDENIPDDPEPNLGFARKVQLTLADGRQLVSEDAVYYPGHWTRRLTEEQLREKFDLFAGAAAEELRLDGIFEKIRRLDEVADINELYATR